METSQSGETSERKPVSVGNLSLYRNLLYRFNTCNVDIDIASILGQFLPVQGGKVHVTEQKKRYTRQKHIHPACEHAPGEDGKKICRARDRRMRRAKRRGGTRFVGSHWEPVCRIKYSKSKKTKQNKKNKNKTLLRPANANVQYWNERKQQWLI